MHTEVTVTRVYSLTLTEAEAAWLKRVCQNPINTTLEAEPTVEKEIRESFFSQLTYANTQE